MIQTTIGKAMETFEEEQCLYVYRDEDTIFYVGRSIHPYTRLLEHLGKGARLPWPDRVGQIILDNMPESLNWTMEIWELKELITAKEYEQIAMHDVFIQTCEEELIYRLGPCLNAIVNKNGSHLPERYNKRPIANEGVKLNRKKTL